MNIRSLARVLVVLAAAGLVGCASNSTSRNFDAADQVKFTRSVSPLGQLSSDAGATSREEWTFRGDGSVTRITQTRTGHVRREQMQMTPLEAQALFTSLDRDGVLQLRGEGVYKDRLDQVGLITAAAQIDAQIGSRKNCVHLIDQQWPEQAQKVVQTLENAAKQAQPSLRWTVASGEKPEMLSD